MTTFAVLNFFEICIFSKIQNFVFFNLFKNTNSFFNKNNIYIFVFKKILQPEGVGEGARDLLTHGWVPLPAGVSARAGQAVSREPDGGNIRINIYKHCGFLEIESCGCRIKMSTIPSFK